MEQSPSGLWENSSIQKFTGNYDRIANTTSPRIWRIKNEGGFVLAFTMSLSSILLICLFGLLAVQWFLSQKEALQYSCEKYNLQAQQILIDGAHQVMALNPKATALALEKKMLELQMRLAPGPEKLAIAALLIKVAFAITALKANQKLIIQTAEARAKVTLLQINRSAGRIAKTLKDFKKLGRDTSPVVHWVSYPTPKIKLLVNYPDPTVRTYHFPPNYQTLQELLVTIDLTSKSLFPSWLTLTEPDRKEPLRWRESCATQPKKQIGDLKWKSYLSAARRL